MAQRHLLNIEVVPSNEKTLHLFDASQYAPFLSIDCTRLEITVPGFVSPKVINVPKNFNLSFNAVSLSLTPETTEELPALPDGIYTVRYSVSPNNLLWVELDHLKTSSIDNFLYRERCRLGLGNCSPSEEVYKKMLKIREIEDYVKAAKGFVEHCDYPEKGMELLNYAKTLLTRLSGKFCC